MTETQSHEGGMGEVWGVTAQVAESGAHKNREMGKDVGVEM